MAGRYKSYRSSLNSILNWRFYHFTNYNTCALKHLILINSEQKWHPKHPKKYLASQDIMTCNEISESTIHFNTKSHQNLRLNNSLKSTQYHTIQNHHKTECLPPITQKAVVRYKISPRCMVSHQKSLAQERQTKMHVPLLN